MRRRLPTLPRVPPLPTLPVVYPPFHSYQHYPPYRSYQAALLPLASEIANPLARREFLAMAAAALRRTRMAPSERALRRCGGGAVLPARPLTGSPPAEVEVLSWLVEDPAGPSCLVVVVPLRSGRRGLGGGAPGVLWVVPRVLGVDPRVLGGVPGYQGWSPGY